MKTFEISLWKSYQTPLWSSSPERRQLKSPQDLYSDVPWWDLWDRACFSGWIEAWTSICGRCLPLCTRVSGCYTNTFFVKLNQFTQVVLVISGDVSLLTVVSSRFRDLDERSWTAISSRISSRLMGEFSWLWKRCCDKFDFKTDLPNEINMTYYLHVDDYPRIDALHLISVHIGLLLKN